MLRQVSRPPAVDRGGQFSTLRRLGLFALGSRCVRALCCAELRGNMLVLALVVASVLATSCTVCGQGEGSRCDDEWGHWAHACTALCCSIECGVHCNANAECAAYVSCMEATSPVGGDQEEGDGASESESEFSLADMIFLSLVVICVSIPALCYYMKCYKSNRGKREDAEAGHADELRENVQAQAAARATLKYENPLGNSLAAEETEEHAGRGSSD